MDNIFVERLWRSLKYEEVYLKDYASVAEARAGIAAYFRLLQPRTFAPEPRLSDAGDDLLGGVNVGMSQRFSVLFPSLSREILGKAGAVSRVRFAAQKPRALDTAPTFQTNPTEKKAKGRSSQIRSPWLLPPGAASTAASNSIP